MKTQSIVKYLFAIIGLGMLIGSFFLFQNTQNFLQEAVTADGEVIELIRSESRNSSSGSKKNVSYRPVVEFKTSDGTVVEFTSSTGSNPASHSRGEAVEVLYEELTPEKARIKGFFSLWGASLIVGCLGGIFFLIGFGIILFGNLKGKKIKRLKESGLKTITKFQSVNRNETLKVNGRNPYQILTHWNNPATSELHMFKSENLWFDPTDHIKQEEITVLIDRDNPKKYYMDTSFLPKLAD